MLDKTHVHKLLIPRGGRDRREHIGSVPPYFTEEGLVLFDRREQGERRNIASSGSSAKKHADAKG